MNRVLISVADLFFTQTSFKMGAFSANDLAEHGGQNQAGKWTRMIASTVSNLQGKLVGRLIWCTIFARTDITPECFQPWRPVQKRSCWQLRHIDGARYSQSLKVEANTWRNEIIHLGTGFLTISDGLKRFSPAERTLRTQNPTFRAAQNHIRQTTSIDASS